MNTGTGEAPSLIHEGVAMIFARQIADLSTLRKVYQFDRTAYVNESGQMIDDIPFALFLEWWQAFPAGFLCSYRGSEPTSVFGLFPVTMSWADHFLAGRITEFELSANIILEARKERLHWYLSGLSSDRTAAGEMAVRLPCVLGYSFRKWLTFNSTVLGDRPVRIVAEGTTSVGERLLKIMHFHQDLPARSRLQKPRFALEATVHDVLQTLRTTPFFGRCSALQADLTRELNERAAVIAR